jgi:hypothetical protein
MSINQKTFKYVRRLGVLSLLLAASALAQSGGYITTPITGAQTFINTSATSTWTITPTFNFGFGGGRFTMKADGTASAAVTLSVYDGSVTPVIWWALRH